MAREAAGRGGARKGSGQKNSAQRGNTAKSPAGRGTTAEGHGKKGPMQRGPRKQDAEKRGTGKTESSRSSRSSRQGFAIQRSQKQPPALQKAVRIARTFVPDFEDDAEYEPPSTHWRETAGDITGGSYDYKYATLFDLIKAAEGGKDALIVALDHITDAGNMGALLRSAEVVGALGALIPSKRSAPVNEAVYRTSAGAVEHLKVAREANLANSLLRLKEEGFWIAGATEHADQDIWSSPLEGRLVIVMGAEDAGLSRLVRDTCDFEFKLPQRGVTQSLNVAQAFTAIAYEWLRRTDG